MSTPLAGTWLITQILAAPSAEPPSAGTLYYVLQPLEAQAPNAVTQSMANSVNGAFSGPSPVLIFSRRHSAELDAQRTSVGQMQIETAELRQRSADLAKGLDGRVSELAGRDQRGGSKQPDPPTTETYLRKRVRDLLPGKAADCQIDKAVVKNWLKGAAPRDQFGPYSVTLKPMEDPTKDPTLGLGSALERELLAIEQVSLVIGPDILMTSGFELRSTHLLGSIDIKSPATLTGALWIAEAIGISSARYFRGVQVLAEFVERSDVDSSQDLLFVAYFRDGALWRVRAGLRGEHPDLHASATHVHVDFTKAVKKKP